MQLASLTLAIAALAVAAFVVMSVGLGHLFGATPASSPIVIGGSPLLDRPAPPVALNTDGGQTISLASLRGQPVIVNFWASWCIPCKQEFPLFAAARHRYRGEGLEILGVVYKDTPASARAFMTDEQANWPMLLDPTGAVAAAYGVHLVPQSYFVDRAGIVRWVSFGSPLTAAALDDILARILGPT